MAAFTSGTVGHYCVPRLPRVRVVAATAALLTPLSLPHLHTAGRDCGPGSSSYGGSGGLWWWYSASSVIPKLGLVKSCLSLPLGCKMVVGTLYIDSLPSEPSHPPQLEVLKISGHRYLWCAVHPQVWPPRLFIIIVCNLAKGTGTSLGLS